MSGRLERCLEQQQWEIFPPNLKSMHPPFSILFDGYFPDGSGLDSTRNVSILDFIGTKDDGSGEW